MRQPGIYIPVALALSLFLAPAPPTQSQEPGAPPPPKPVKVERARIVPLKPATPAPSAPAEKPAERPRSETPLPETPPAETPLFGSSQTDAPPGHHAVREVRLIHEGGGRMEGSRQGDWIAFDKKGDNDLYDVYILALGAGSEQCLTCDYWEFRKTHVLNPTWHPSGEVLIVQVQSSAKRRGLDAVGLALPHRGLGSELWAVTRDGKDAVQLTRFGERGSAVLDPHFSHEAGLLVWSERLKSREGGPWGQWGLQVSEVKIGRGIARLGKSRLYKTGLGTGLAVAHDFSPDDGGLLVSAIPDRGLLKSDILRLDLETERIDRLTSSPDQNDELVTAVPYSDYYVWVTDRGFGGPGLPGGQRGPLPRRNEVWLRSASGMAQERLTYFNDTRSGHYLGQAMIGDVSWMADGEGLLLHVLSAPERSTEVKQAIFLVRLGKEYRR